ncbi:MAG: YdcF family protein [Myxococcota bacterium]|nr:YdcF family protein [Myxococcota bacterium]
MLSRGLEELAERLARTAVRSDPGTHADVAIVLGGAPRYRAPTAVTLWRSGAVAAIVAVGGADGHSEARRTAAILAGLGVPESAVVVLAEDAPGTWDEARVVARAAQEHGWSSVVVVTSAYHTRRAGHLFECAMGPSVRVSVRAAVDEPWTTGSWWKSPHHRRLLFAEPIKYLGWRTGLRAAWWRYVGARPSRRRGSA